MVQAGRRSHHSALISSAVRPVSSAMSAAEKPLPFILRALWRSFSTAASRSAFAASARAVAASARAVAASRSANAASRFFFSSASSSLASLSSPMIVASRRTASQYPSYAAFSSSLYADSSTIYRALETTGSSKSSCGTVHVSSSISVRNLSHNTAIFFSAKDCGLNFGSSMNTR